MAMNPEDTMSMRQWIRQKCGTVKGKANGNANLGTMKEISVGKILTYIHGYTCVRVYFFTLYFGKIRVSCKSAV